ncbi:MAG: AMP-binding protein [Syntrophomonadaceae bacterium]|jgi:fatty-acyl-CoA synthase
MSYTIQSLLFRGMRRFKDSPAITMIPSEETITYRELLDKITAVAGYYHTKLNILPCTRVCLIIPNSIEFSIFSKAGVMCGATLSSLNEMLGVRELESILNQLRPKVVIVSTNQKHIEAVLKHKQEVDPNVKIVGIPGMGVDYPEEFIIFDWNEAKPVANLPQASPDDICRIGFTGGTTGAPKGVMQSQYGTAMNIIAHLVESTMDQNTRVYFATPLQHASGLMFWTALCGGAHCFVSRNFDMGLLLKTIKDKQITTLSTIPTILYRIVELGRKMKLDFSSLTSVTYGTSPMIPERLVEAIELMGPIFRQSYGLTEVPNLVTTLSKFDHMWALENYPRALASCGKVLPMVEVKILDENNNEVPLGERGEICVKSAYNAVGYLNNPELTAKTIVDGWLHTGDIGEFDEYGFLYIVDRKKDMIISGGMNVYPKEVESVLAQHPSVAVSACFGIPDDNWGEAVCVYAVLKEGAAASEEELITYCKERTAKYMVPKKIKFITMNQLPLTAAGKIDKKLLRAPYWAGRDRQI